MLLRSGGGVATERERVELPDGDFLDLDRTVAAAGRPAPADAPLVVILHGLEGSWRSGYVREAQRALARLDLASVVLNFRSCSGAPNRLARFYHSGDTADLGYVLARLEQRFPGRALGAVGFSLGGNVLVKYLGECGAAGRPPGVVAAAAVSVPFDLAAGAAKLEQAGSRIYAGYLLRKLRRKVRLKAVALDGHVDVGALLRARTLREFDELGTAPLHGFADADDYYRRSSSGPVLDTVAVPTLLVHAADDPFIPAASMPHEAVGRNPHLEARFSADGGHVGFVAGPPWAPRFRAERWAAEHLAARLNGGAQSPRSG
jgi:predicted alpha/beta-fold hydrolase